MTETSTRAPRLPTLDGARLGLLSSGKRNCDLLLQEIGAAIGERYRLAGVSFWRKSSVYRFASPRRLEEVRSGCDALVAGLGDWGHGSACSLHDVYQLERLGLPVAYIDTPGRIHAVRKEEDVFVVDYAANRYVGPARTEAWSRLTPRLRKVLHVQGYLRALRDAGARVGDRARIGAREVVIEEMPETSYPLLRDYTYIVTAPIGRLTPSEVKARSRELLPSVVAALTTG